MAAAREPHGLREVLQAASAAQVHGSQEPLQVHRGSHGPTRPRGGAERPAEFRFPRAPPPERLLPCAGKRGERRDGRRRGAERLSSDILAPVRPLRCTGMGPATRLCPTAEPATRCSPGAAQPGSSPRQPERPVPAQLFLCWRLGSEDLGWLQKLTVTRSSP